RGGRSRGGRGGRRERGGAASPFSVSSNPQELLELLGRELVGAAGAETAAGAGGGRLVRTGLCGRARVVVPLEGDARQLVAERALDRVHGADLARGHERDRGPAR